MLDELKPASTEAHGGIRRLLLRIGLNRGVLVLWVYLGLLLVPAVRPGQPRPFPDNLFLDGWFRWDSGWYANIIQHGYRLVANEEGQRNTAFFPLYPLLSRAVAWLVGNPYLAAFIVSNAALLIACLLLFRMTTRRYGAGVGLTTVSLLLSYPYSYYLTSMHTESLFLLGAVGAFYFADRRHWLLASLFAAGASATRVAGVLVGLGLLVSYLEQAEYRFERIRADIAALILCPMGLIAHMSFLWLRFGDPFEFAAAQRAPGWAGGFTADKQGPAWAAARAAEQAAPHDVLGMLAMPLQICLALLAAWLLVTARRLPASYRIWALATLALSAASPGSLGRFVLVIFPVFIAAAQRLSVAPRARGAILAVGSALIAFLAYRQAHGFWTAG